MALKVNSFSTVSSASENLTAASNEYKAALDEIRRLVQSTSSVWIGADADAYRAKVLKAVGEGGGDAPLEKVEKEIKSHAETLATTSAILSKISSNIASAMS